jgi:transposase
VPDKIVGVKELKKTYMLAPNRLIGEGNNKFVEVGSIYGDTNQRWVLVYSKQANERAKKTIERNIEKEKKQYEKFIEKITKQRFACEKDAKEIIARDFKKMQFHRLNNIEITKESDSSEFRAKMQLEKHLEAIQKRIWDSSTFVLSTTQLDAAKLPTSAVLSHYKTQSPLEGRFNLLKNAQCIASNFYVKNDNRIAALAMVMCLCILIYSLTERQLRKALSESNKTVPNQKGKRIKNPTMKWVYSMFEAIYIEVSRHKDKITYTIFNLTDELVEILKSLGQECMKIYGLAA